MFGKPSLLTRVTIAKMVGFAFGLIIGFLAAPAFGVDDMKLRLAILFWYTTIGAFIGVAGVMTRHPLLNMKFPWWLTGAAIGGWMNFVLVLFAWDVFAPIMAGGAFWGFTSPWWMVFDGLFAGFVIAGLATRVGGEGPATVQDRGYS